MNCQWITIGNMVSNTAKRVILIAAESATRNLNVIQATKLSISLWKKKGFLFN